VTAHRSSSGTRTLPRIADAVIPHPEDSNYHLTKRFGEAAGLARVMAPELIEALNRVHHAARRGRQLPRGLFFRDTGRSVAPDG